MDGGKKNVWLSHVKKTMKAHKGMKFTQVLKLAKKTYKKQRGGAEVKGYDDFGADADIVRVGNLSAPLQDSSPVGGRRRTRRGRKHSRRH